MSLHGHIRDKSPHTVKMDKGTFVAFFRGSGSGYQMCMVKTFNEALGDAVARNKTSLAAVAEATGVSYEQLKKLRQRPNASTNVDDAKLIANHFGMSLDEFLGDDLAQDRAAVVEAYNRLTPEERALLRRLSPSDQ